LILFIALSFCFISDAFQAAIIKKTSLYTVDKFIVNSIKAELLIRTVIERAMVKKRTKKASAFEYSNTLAFLMAISMVMMTAKTMAFT